jgi:hypothetical protein
MEQSHRDDGMQGFPLSAYCCIPPQPATVQGYRVVTTANIRVGGGITALEGCGGVSPWDGLPQPQYSFKNFI